MEIFRTEKYLLNNKEKSEIIALLNSKSIGIFPTDSVYTLACSLNNKSGIERICKLVNKRPESANLSLICSSFEMIAQFCVPFSTSVFRIMKAALPGPYTFILNADVRQTKHWENRRKTIGVRMPDETFLPDIINGIDAPLICSSLHSDDELLQYFIDPDEIEKKYNNSVDFFIDEGMGQTIPSTVVDCTSNTPELLRLGFGKWPL